MKKRRIEVVTHKQFQNCIFAGVKVEIWIGEECDESVILEFNDEIFKASNGFYYIRANCRLYITNNYFRLVH